MYFKPNLSSIRKENKIELKKRKNIKGKFEKKLIFMVTHIERASTELFITLKYGDVKRLERRNKIFIKIRNHCNYSETFIFITSIKSLHSLYSYVVSLFKNVYRNL